MLSVFFSFIASISYGTGDFIAGRLAKKLPSALIVFLTQGTQAVFVLLFALLSRQQYSSEALVWGILGGIANGTAYMLYYRALTLGKAGIVAPLAASSAAIPLLISIVMGNIPNWYVLSGLTLVLSGIIGATFTPQKQDPNAIPLCRGIVMLVVWKRPRIVIRPAACILLALGASVCFGVALTLEHHGAKTAGGSINWLVWGFQLGTLPVTLLSAITIKTSWAISQYRSTILTPLCMIMLLNMSGDILIAYAFRKGVLGIVSVFASLAPVVTTLLAAVLLSERLSKSQKLSAAAIITGTLIIQKFS